MHGGLICIAIRLSVCLSVRLWLDQNSDLTKIQTGQKVTRPDFRLAKRALISYFLHVDGNCQLQFWSEINKSCHWQVCSLQRQVAFFGIIQNKWYFSTTFQKIQEETFLQLISQTLLLGKLHWLLSISCKIKYLLVRERSYFLMVECTEYSSSYSIVGWNITDNGLFYMTSRIDFCWTRLGA